MTHQTPLHDRHVAIGAHMVDFHGWEMPLQYAGIKEEHRRVRTAAGLFDLCHMARLAVTGPGREALVGHGVTCDVTQCARDEARYGLVCDEAGGVIDDVVVYRCEWEVLVVANASNREAVRDHLSGLAPRFGAEVEDRTFAIGMVAVQGPASQAILARLAGMDLASIRYYHSCEGMVAGQEARVSRTGYTGEDGFEVYCATLGVGAVWDEVMEAGRPEGLAPVGLGARDTLRLEAAMPLYGHELSLDRDPISAGLSFAVNLDKPDFIGKAALARVKAAGPRERLVCLHVESGRVAREGFQVLADGVVVGRVTSGTYSPTLDRNIAMAYVRTDLATPGTRLAVDVRGEAVPVVVVKRPFYKRKAP